jgi:hypothetical protein
MQLPDFIITKWKSTVSWAVTPCSLDTAKHFGETHLQSWRVSQARNSSILKKELTCSPKTQAFSKIQHVAMQKTFKLTDNAMQTSNRTYIAVCPSIYIFKLCPSLYKPFPVFHVSRIPFILCKNGLWVMLYEWKLKTFKPLYSIKIPYLFNAVKYNYKWKVDKGKVASCHSYMQELHP